MEAQINLIDEIQNNIQNQERVYRDIETFNKERGNNNSLILYLNIRSLNANFEKLQLFIKGLKIKPDVIVCTEVWKLIHYQYYKMKDYKLYYNHGDINKNDGVVVYIRENIEHTSDTVVAGKLKIINTCITLNNNKQLEISSLYRSHGLTCTEFNLNFKNYLEQKRKIRNHIIIGDFNINIQECNTISVDFQTSLLEKGFYPGFTNTTRPANLTTEKGSCIDNIFIKTDFLSTKSLTLMVPITDHYPLFLEIKNGLTKKNETEPDKYYISYKKLFNMAKQIDWSKHKNKQDPNETINNIIKEIQICFESSKYKKPKLRNSKKTARKDWMTNAILNSCNTKESLYNKLKKNPDNEELKNNYKKFVKTLDKVIKAAKIEYDKKTIENNSNEPRKLWACINDKIGKTKKKSDTNISQLKTEDNTIIKGKDEIANKINDYYCKLGEKLSNKITTPKHRKLELPRSNPKTIFLKPTNEIEIMKIIYNLKMKKGGIDKINAKTLKIIAELIADTLAYAINQCIEMSIWPDMLKVAEVIPIYKAGKKNEMGNYRPISLISNIAKIFEKIIHIRIIDFISQSKIMSKNQFGFRKNIGTKDALSLITKTIYENLDQSKPIAITFLDLAKAFDTVNHQILLDKLYAYGIRGKAHKLIKSYLSNRKQKVRIGTHVSNFENINTGVPQGTILGPLLFILYVNDLLINMPENSILSYADDTAIIANGKTWTEVETKMNDYLDDVSTWLKLNKLTLNIQKTAYITFGCYSDSLPQQIEIKIDSENLNRVRETKYLGIIFDENVKWNKHIEYLISKTKYLIFIFSKITTFMDINTLKIIYYAFFHSLISYGIIAWGGAYTNKLQLLQTVQTRILKIINKNTFQKINPLNLKQLFASESLRHNYNSLKDQYVKSTSRTRHKAIITPKYYKTVSTKNNYIKAINIFNKLPNEFKMLDIKKKASIAKIKDWLRNNE